MKLFPVRESRKATLVWLLLALSISGFSVYGDRTSGLAVGFWIIAATVFAAKLLRPTTLDVGPDGLTVSGGLRRSPLFLAWSDVARFGVARVRFGVDELGFDYADQSKSKDAYRVWHRSVRGTDGVISGDWSCPANVLADRLNRCREEALAARNDR